MNLLDLFIKVSVDDQASSKIGGITEGAITKATMMGNALYDVTKAVATRGYEAVSGLVQGAVAGYGQYEQLIGGVDKLYGAASGKIQEYAQNAYKTSGMSANQYMEQATSFSAALISSLGGDVDKAADLTDVAMRSMSDNVDTFGSDMQSVQYAFQGFAKQNYTMLDNLKLGYGGTKEEMQRLIKDASEMTDVQQKLGLTVDSTSMSFDNIISAIAVMQDSMNIAGTTAKEAMGTIEGSTRMAKASWDNLITAIGAGDSEMISNAVSGLADAIFGSFSEETQKREGGLINNILPVLKNVGKALVNTIPSVAKEMVGKFVEAFNETFGTDFNVDEIVGRVEGAISGFVENVKKFIEGVKEFWSGFVSTVDPTPFQEAFDLISEIVGKAVDWFSQNGETIGIIIGGIVNAIGTVIGIVTQVIEFVTPIVETIIGFITDIATAIADFISDNEAAKEAIIGAWNAVVDFFKKIPEWWNGVVDDWKKGIDSIKKDHEEKAKAISLGWEDMKERTSKAWQSAGESVKKWADSINKAISDWTRGAADGIKKGWGEIVKFFQGIPQTIGNAFRNAGSWLVNAGKNIINGFLNGLKSAWGGVTGFIGGIGSWIQNHKGPEAYDRALLINNGKWIMDGLQNGLEQSFEGDVVPYVSDMADSMRNAFGTPTLSAYAASARGNVQYALPQQNQSKQLTVILELDKMQFARAVYNLNNEETQRVGVSLARGFA